MLPYTTLDYNSYAGNYNNKAQRNPNQQALPKFHVLTPIPLNKKERRPNRN